MTSVSTTVEVSLANSSTTIVASGNVGQRGPQGLQGEPGADGAQGPQGDVGPPGVSEHIIRIILDNNGGVLDTGDMEVYVSVPFDCTINKVRLLSSVTGSIVVDIWKDSYANFPPTVTDTITAGAKPTLTAARKYEDTTLTGWNTTLLEGDIIEVNVDSVTSITKLYIDLFVS